MAKNKDIQIPIALTCRIGDNRAHMVRALIRNLDKRVDGRMNWQRFFDRLIEESYARRNDK